MEGHGGVEPDDLQGRVGDLVKKAGEDGGEIGEIGDGIAVIGDESVHGLVEHGPVRVRRVWVVGEGFGDGNLVRHAFGARERQTVHCRGRICRAKDDNGFFLQRENSKSLNLVTVSTE